MKHCCRLRRKYGPEPIANEEHACDTCVASMFIMLALKHLRENLTVRAYNDAQAASDYLRKVVDDGA